MARAKLRMIRGGAPQEALALEKTQASKPTGKLARLKPLHPTLVCGPDGEYVRDKDGKYLFKDEKGYFYESKDVICPYEPIPKRP
ncbi:MAG: hypothetical protein ACLQU2_01715 [Candidatus Binataceae bacterium]